jgi:hypothetical protein
MAVDVDLTVSEFLKSRRAAFRIYIPALLFIGAGLLPSAIASSLGHVAVPLVLVMCGFMVVPGIVSLFQFLGKRLPLFDRWGREFSGWLDKPIWKSND